MGPPLKACRPQGGSVWMLVPPSRWKTDWQHKSETKVGKKNKTNLTSYVSPLCCLTQLHAKPSCERHQLMRISLPCKISKPTMMYYVENKTVRALVGCSQTLRRPASGLWRASSNCLLGFPSPRIAPACTSPSLGCLCWFLPCLLSTGAL